MRAVVSTIEFDVTGKRVFVVGPVFSDQLAVKPQ
jgi:hypothetical protein